MENLIYIRMLANYLWTNPCYLYQFKKLPSNTKHWPNAGLMLDQRLRRWPNIKPALGQCFVFAGRRGSDDAAVRKYWRVKELTNLAQKELIMTRRRWLSSTVTNWKAQPSTPTQCRLNVVGVLTTQRRRFMLDGRLLNSGDAHNM